MAATVQISRYHGSGPTKVNSVTRTDWLSLAPAGFTTGSEDLRSTFPISKPSSGSVWSFDNWHKFECTSLGSSTAISDLKYYSSGAPGTGWTLRTTANTTPISPTYVAPDANSKAGTTITTAMPTAEPGTYTIACPGPTNTMGVASSLYVADQLECASTVTGGVSLTIQWKYTEA